MLSSRQKQLINGRLCISFACGRFSRSATCGIAGGRNNRQCPVRFSPGGPLFWRACWYLFNSLFLLFSVAAELSADTPFRDLTRRVKIELEFRRRGVARAERGNEGNGMAGAPPSISPSSPVIRFHPMCRQVSRFVASEKNIMPSSGRRLAPHQQFSLFSLTSQTE